MSCPCKATPCRVLPINGGATWFYDATRGMNDGERMFFRAAHADSAETRDLTVMIALAVGIFAEQQPHLIAQAEPTS